MRCIDDESLQGFENLCVESWCYMCVLCSTAKAFCSTCAKVFEDHLQSSRSWMVFHALRRATFRSRGAGGRGGGGGELSAASSYGFRFHCGVPLRAPAALRLERGSPMAVIMAAQAAATLQLLLRRRDPMAAIMAAADGALSAAADCARRSPMAAGG